MKKNLRRILIVVTVQAAAIGVLVIAVLRIEKQIEADNQR